MTMNLCTPNQPRDYVPISDHALWVLDSVGILTLKSRTDTLRRIGNLRTAALVGIISAQLSGLLHLNYILVQVSTDGSSESPTHWQIHCCPLTPFPTVPIRSRELLCP